MSKEITTKDLAFLIQKGFKDQGKKTDKKIDNLAGMVKRGLDDLSGEMTGFKKDVNKRFEQVDKRFDSLEKRMDERFAYVNSRIDIVETRIANMDVVSRSEFDDLLGRVAYMERKLSIVSGK